MMYCSSQESLISSIYSRPIRASLVALAAALLCLVLAGSAAATPAATITQPTPGEVLTDSYVDFGFELSDSYSAQCRVDPSPGDSWDSGAEYCYPFDPPQYGLTNGEHTIEVRPMKYIPADPWYEYGPVVSVTFTVDDHSAPSALVASPVDEQAYTTTSVPIEFTLDGESGLSVDCEVDGEPDTCEDGADREWANGAHTITIDLSDPAGNGSPVTIDFTVSDSTAPVIELNNPADGSTITDADDLTLDFTVDGESGRSATCSYDGSPGGACMDGAWISFLGGGSHSVSVTRTDGNGLTGTADADFTIDIAAPVVEVTAPAPGTTWTSSTVVVDFTVDGDSGSGQCKIDSGSWEYCYAGDEITGVADGLHNLYIKVYKSGIGYVETGPYEFTVANSPGPVILVHSPEEDEALDSGIVDIAFSTYGATSMNCKLDDVPFYCSIYTTTVELQRSLSNGPHELSITATDSFGAQRTVDHDFSVNDPVTPSLQVDAPEDGATLSSSLVAFAYSSDDPDADARCRFSKGGGPWSTWQGCDDGATFELENGSYQLAVELKDPAGNTASGLVSFSVNDLSPPDLVISSPGDGSTLSSGVVPFEYTVDGIPDAGGLECSIDGGYWSSWSCFSPFRLTNGQHQLEARVTDGNGLTTEVVHSFSVNDTVPPTVTISAPVEGATLTALPSSFSFTVSEPTRQVACLIDGSVVAEAYGSSTSCWINSGVLVTNGSHVAAVVATDVAGLTTTETVNFTLNRPGPAQASIYSPSVGETLTNSAEHFEFYAAGGAVAECRLDTRPWTLCNSAWAHRFTTMPNGAHTFYIRLTTPDGLQSTAARSFSVDDTTPPTVSVTRPLEGATLEAGSSIYASIGYSGGSSARCSIDGGRPRSCAGGFELDTTGLSNGPHALTVEAADPAGNVGSLTRGFNVGSGGSPAAMNPQILDPVDGATLDSRFKLHYSTESSLVAKLYGRIDSGDWQLLDKNRGEWRIGPIDEGAHTLTIRAVDALGNALTDSVAVTVQDDAAPSVEITTPAPGETVTVSPPRIRFQADSDVVDAQCKTDAGPFVACNSYFAYRPKPLTNGEHTATVRVTDRSGKSSQTTRTYNLADTFPVNFKLRRPIEGATINQIEPTSIDLEIPDDGLYSDVSCTVNGQPLVPCGDGTALTDLPAGSVSLAVTLTDGVGNTSTVTRNLTMQRDTTPPYAGITWPKSGATFTDSAAVFGVFDAYDLDPYGNPGGWSTWTQMSCKADSADWGECEWFDSGGNYVIPASNGAHTISLKSTDEFGNFATTGVNYTVNDTTAPVVSIVTPQPSSEVDPKHAHVVIAAEARASLSCSLDSELVFVSCPADFWLGDADDPVLGGGADLTPGSHTLRVRASDPAGNTTTVVSAFEVRVLDTSFVSGPSGAITGTSPSWTLATEPVGRDVECRLDLGAWTPATGGTFAPGPLVQGNYLVQCRAIDIDDTRDSTPATRSITIDTTAPTIAAVSDKTKEATGPDGATVTFAPIVSDNLDGSPTLNCSPASGSKFALGVTGVSCTATDDAGNVSAAEEFTVTVVDTESPEFGSVPDIGPLAAPSSAGMAVTFASPTASDVVSGDLPSTCTPASGSHFAVGSTQVSCTATDGAGHTASVTFDVVVAYNPETEFTAGPNGWITSTSPSWTLASTPAGLEIKCRVGSDGFAAIPGTTFAPGVLSEGAHTIECKAVDGALEDPTPATRTVTVDTTAPTITSAPDKTVEATGPDGANVTFAPAVSDSLDPAPTLGCTPASGSKFPVGQTAATCTATDAAGNNSLAANFTVSVVDTTEPAFGAVADVGPLAAPTAAGRTVTFVAPTATDLVDGSIASGCTPASGSHFNVGSTTVSCAATDAAGNTGSVTFDVVVTDGTPPVVPPPPPPPSNPPSADPPSIVKAPKSAKASKAIKLAVDCDNGCKLSLTVKIGKKKVKLKTVTVKAGATTATIKLPKNVQRRIKSARARSTLTVVPSGSGATGKSIKIRLK